MNKIIKNSASLIFVLILGLFKNELNAAELPAVSDAFGMTQEEKTKVLDAIKTEHVLDLSKHNINDLSDFQVQFSWISDGSGKDLKNQVWVLDLSNNNLESISSGLLMLFPNLKVLKLSHNNLSGVELAGVYDRLGVLDLSFNKIKDVKDLKLAGTNLKLLNLSHNEFSGVVSLLDFKKFQSLVCLILSNNPIKYLSVQTREFCENSGNIKTPIKASSVTSLNDLRTVVLFGCALQAVTSYDFHKLNIRTLILGCNEIKTCENGDGAFCELKQLTSLNLVGNKLTAISGKTFAGAKALKELYLDGNSIDSSKVAPEAFRDLGNLETLSMRCQLKQDGLPAFTKLTKRMFYDLKMLKNLDLSWNGIQGMERSWSDGATTDLSFINLSHNALAVIPGQVVFSKIIYPQLKKLDVKNNGLRSIGGRNGYDGSVFSRLKFMFVGGHSLLLGDTANRAGNPIFDSLVRRLFVNRFKTIWEKRFGLSYVRKMVLSLLHAYDAEVVRKIVFDKDSLQKEFDLLCLDIIRLIPQDKFVSRLATLQTKEGICRDKLIAIDPVVFSMASEELKC
jgi:Leucine-rich repeat (LRR) protein